MSVFELIFFCTVYSQLVEANKSVWAETKKKSAPKVNTSYLEYEFFHYEMN